MTTKAAIEAGLADWSEKVAGAEQFGKYLEKRERERADAARRAQDAPARKVLRGSGGPRPAA